MTPPFSQFKDSPAGSAHNAADDVRHCLRFRARRQIPPPPGCCYPLVCALPRTQADSRGVLILQCSIYQHEELLPGISESYKFRFPELPFSISLLFLKQMKTSQNMHTLFGPNEHGTENHGADSLSVSFSCLLSVFSFLSKCLSLEETNPKVTKKPAHSRLFRSKHHFIL